MAPGLPRRRERPVHLFLMGTKEEMALSEVETGLFCYFGNFSLFASCVRGRLGLAKVGTHLAPEERSDYKEPCGPWAGRAAPGRRVLSSPTGRVALWAEPGSEGPLQAQLRLRGAHFPRGHSQAAQRSSPGSSGPRSLPTQPWSRLRLSP